MAAPPSLPTDPVAGQRLGSYEQERLLVDRGAVQWVVAHAVDDPTRRVVIRKRKETANDRGVHAQFLARARAASKLDLPGLVPVREARLEGSIAYAAMDYLEGATLDGLLRTWATAKAPLPTAFVIGIVVDLLETLEAIHGAPPIQGAPFIHGAIEPRRIRILRNGEVKLGGLAREPDEGGASFYASPEHLRREPLEPKSDVFSIGLLLYELLGGSRPFPSLGLADLRSAMLYQPIPALRDRQPNLRPALDTLVQQTLARDRHTRLGKAGELARRLSSLDSPMAAAARAEWLSTLWRELVQNSAPPVTPSPEASPVPRTATGEVVAPPSSPGRLVALGTGVLALFAASVVGAVLWLTRPPPGPPERQDLTGGMQPIPGVVAPEPATSADGGTAHASANDAGGAVPTAASTSSPPGNPAAPPPPKPARPSGPTGTLTLVTAPPVEVFLRGRPLGKTPLFQIPVPAGTQQLRLRFSDGREQKFPVTVKAGKATQLRLDLH